MKKSSSSLPGIADHKKPENPGGLKRSGTVTSGLDDLMDKPAYSGPAAIDGKEATTKSDHKDPMAGLPQVSPKIGNKYDASKVNGSTLPQLPGTRR
jgi:hypothetical protein